jgi:ribonuclease HII
MLEFEKIAKAQGFVRIAGVDEAGRGPLAGPIVAGAVVLAEPIAGLDDSKRLTPGKRTTLYEQILAGLSSSAVAVVSAAEIDRHGIQCANYRAMASAVENLDSPPDFLLIDGFRVPGLVQPQQRIVKGDQRSLSIAAASILAKVTRDRIMEELACRYPEYGFDRHKGYGTREHLEAIARYGPCPEHRRSFAPCAQTTESGRLFEE